MSSSPKRRTFALAIAKIAVMAPVRITDKQSEEILDQIAWHKIEALVQQETRRVSQLVLGNETDVTATVEV